MVYGLKRLPIYTDVAQKTSAPYMRAGDILAMLMVTCGVTNGCEVIDEGGCTTTCGVKRATS